MGVLARALIVIACVLASAGAVSAQAAPPGAYVPEASMDPSDPGEDWREVEVEHTSLDKALVIPGGVFLGVGWVANWLMALVHSIEWLPGFDQATYLPSSFVPIAGPIVGAVLQGGFDPLAASLHVVFALVQAAGLAMAIVGTVRPRVWTEVEWQRVTVLPWGGPESAGLAARVVF